METKIIMIEFTLAELRIMKIIISDVSFIKDSDFNLISKSEIFEKIREGILEKIEFNLEELIKK